MPTRATVKTFSSSPDFDGSQTVSVSELIVTANRAGGDDSSVNAACDCPSCAGVRIPTLDGPNSPLGPPESELSACDNGAL